MFIKVLEKRPIDYIFKKNYWNLSIIKKVCQLQLHVFIKFRSFYRNIHLGIVYQFLINFAPERLLSFLYKNSLKIYKCYNIISIYFRRVINKINQ